MTDAELVEQARRGDADAFGQLVSRHRGTVYRTALAALGRVEDAEDVAQEAFLTAFRRLQGFRGEASFKTWLLTITWRKALDRRRSVAVWLRRVAMSRATESEDIGDRLPAADLSGEEQLLQAEMRRQVIRLVLAMPLKLRDPLLLMGSGEHTYEQMALMLGIPVGTAKWRVMEARRQLKQKLERLGIRGSTT